MSGDVQTNRNLARDIFWRFYEVYVSRGHEDYIARARRLEDYYLGGGRQWRQIDRAKLEAEGRPAHEINIIMQTVNAAAGFQISNRVDVSMLPRGGRGDEHTAKLLSKVMQHVFHTTKYRHLETDMFLDGIIQQRGYIDIRLDYERNALGEIYKEEIDPMDVIPDPDAKGYDPDKWADVNRLRWMTEREIEHAYGYEVAQEVVARSHSYCDDENFGTERIYRTGFDDIPPSYARNRGWYEDSARHRRYRIIDRQSNEYMLTECAVFPTGDTRVIEGYSREHKAWLVQHGVGIVHKRMRRVRWEVAAPDVVMVNKISPFEHISIVPYFPIFRRGRTVGMVDNMISPQDMLNKFASQYAHVVNSSANGGWQGQADGLENMTDEEFTARAAETGLILLRKSGVPEFKKIEPGQIPTGIDKMIDYAHKHLQQVSGVDENLAGAPRDGMSGVAIQSLQYVSQQKLALQLDNLSKTRHLVVDRDLKIIQKYLGSPRVIRITEMSPYGVEKHRELPINQVQPDGSVMYDVTVGEYDVAVQERPAQATFDTSEFNQMIEMKKAGIPVPDAAIIRASTLADKSDIADQMEAMQGQVDPQIEFQNELLRAQARKADADALTKTIEGMFSAMQTAQLIATVPGAAPMADAMLRSAGFEDADAPPLIPDAPAGLALPPPETNTNPLTPANPGVGLTAGLSDAPANPPVSTP